MIEQINAADFDNLEPPLDSAVRDVLAEPLPDDAVERVKTLATRLETPTVSLSKAIGSFDESEGNGTAMNELSNEHVSELDSRFARDHEDLPDRLQHRRTLPRPVSRSRHLLRIAASLAAVVVVVAFAILLLMPQQVTLADVEAAVDRQVWIHEKFDDGAESWTCRSLGKRFTKDANGRIQLFDDVNYLWMQYWPGDDHIRESRPTSKQIEEIKRRNLSRDDLRELRRKPVATQPSYERKQEKETVDGRELLRGAQLHVDR